MSHKVSIQTLIQSEFSVFIIVKARTVTPIPHPQTRSLLCVTPLPWSCCKQTKDMCNSHTCPNTLMTKKSNKKGAVLQMYCGACDCEHENLSQTLGIVSCEVTVSTILLKVGNVSLTFQNRPVLGSHRIDAASLHWTLIAQSESPI